MIPFIKYKNIFLILTLVLVAGSMRCRDRGLRFEARH